MIEDSLAEIREELERLAARLDDLITDTLRSAIEAGEERRPELERRLTRVRNALLRAEGLLGQE